jgi:hypothetical protein
MKNNKTAQILALSFSLLFAVFFAAKAHGEERFVVVEKLKTWQAETNSRTDLEDREKDQRLQLINRLIFQTERKYQENSLKEFVQTALEDMMEADQLTSNQSFESQELFLQSLYESYTSLLENREDPLAFLEAFTEFSSVTNPLSADEFAETRSYFDGKNVLAAQSSSIEEATEIIEQREKSLESPTRTMLDENRNLMQDFTPELLEQKSQILNQSLTI